MMESTAFVGRAAEVRKVLEMLEAVRLDGNPRALTIVGTAGIGKSRLVHEVRRTVDTRARVLHRAGRHDAAALGVVGAVLSQRFFGTGDSSEAAIRTAAIEAFGERNLDEILHFLGRFVGIDFPRSPFLKAFEGESREQMQMGRVILRRFFEADARRFGPTMVVLEDLHCAPKDTLDLVEDLIRTLSNAPVLLLCTGRPELLGREAAWVHAKFPHHSLLDLPPLSETESAGLVASAIGDSAPPDAVERAVTSGRGNPYLLEQTVHAYWRKGVLFREPDGRVAVRADRMDGARIPWSVRDAIAGRLAALKSESRELLERAATMGPVFWAGALVALGRLDQHTPDLWGVETPSTDRLSETLEELVSKGFVVAHEDSSVPGEREYSFRHNLEREALSERLPAALAADYHRAVGEWLEFRLAERAEQHCELLAHHFEQAGLERKAAHYSLRAGDRARARFANAKAAEHYTRGLGLLGSADRPKRLEALHHYGDVLQLAGRNDDALEMFREMLTIAFQLDLRSKGGAAHNRIGRLYRATGRLDEAMRHLSTGYSLFERADDARGIASSLDDIGKVHWMRGAYTEAERFMHASLERRQKLGDQRSIALSFNNLGLVFQDSGRFEEARVHFQEALLLRRAIDDPPGIAQTLNNLGSVAQDRGDHRRAAELYREALEVAEETGDLTRQAVILTNLGETHYRLSAPAAAIEVLERASKLATPLGDRILEGEILRGLAKAFLLTGNAKEASAFIERSIALFESADSPAFLETALRTKAQVDDAANQTQAGTAAAESGEPSPTSACAE